MKKLDLMMCRKNLLAVVFAFLLAFVAGCAASGQPSGSDSQATSQPTSANEKIGIIGAMDAEVDHLKSAAGAQSSTAIAGMDFCEGTIGENPSSS